MASKPFTTVTFLNEDRTEELCSEAVPNSWVFEHGTRAYWPDPPKKGHSDPRSKMVMTLQKPDTSWPSYPCKVRHSFDKYKKAREAANKQNDETDTVVTEPSDLEGVKRKRKRNTRYDNSSSDEEVQVKKKHKHKKKRKHVVYTDDEEEDQSVSTSEANLQAKIQDLLKLKEKPHSSQRQPGKTLLKVSAKENTPTTSKQQSNSDVGMGMTSRLGTRTVVRTASLTQIIGNTNSNKRADFTQTSGPGASSLSPCHESVPETLGDGSITEELRSSFFDALNESIQNKDTASQQSGSRSPSKLSTDENVGDANDGGSVKDSESKGAAGTGDDISSIGNPPLKMHSTKSVEERVRSSLISELSSKVDMVLLNQARLFSLLAPEEEFVERPPNLPPTPLKSVKAFSEFEVFLTKPVNADTLVTHLKLCVMDSASERDATAALLKMLISNNLSRALSWAGRCDKEKFSTSKLMNVISRVILKVFPKSRLVDCKNKVQRWLETSSQRKPDSDSDSEKLD
ncbi:uncharacterized protein LOC117642416 [Thrips palmi]|uniref:Uncharacterized protein LOC117642416 n=1 Tax=Thrips palmi TaxID=161013 RepID=A0A6P8YHP7_THRPL|nr:uncharacterized protein LOC117642416 [Thrips palmi]